MFLGHRQRSWKPPLAQSGQYCLQIAALPKAWAQAFSTHFPSESTPEESYHTSALLQSPQHLH